MNGHPVEDNPGEDAGEAVHQDRDIGRILALSDGVFAIAITLLVFQLQITQTLADPDSWQDLADAIGGISSKLISYAITFMVLGAYWLAHHRLFRVIERHDRRLLLLNLIYLLGVAFVPFPAELLGSYENNPLAVMIYAANLAWLSVLSGVIGLHARRAGLTVRLAGPALRMGQWRAWGSAGIFLLSMPIAIVSPAAAKYCWILLWPFLTLATRKTAASGLKPETNGPAGPHGRH